MTEIVMNKSASPSITRKFGLFVLGSIFLAVLFFAAVRLFVKPGFDDTLFCQPESVVYQAIATYGDGWFDQLMSSPLETHIDFTTDHGQKFTAIKLDIPDGFFVVVEYDLPHTYIGERGYMFTRESVSQARREYTYTQMSENIYCYQKS